MKPLVLIIGLSGLMALYYTLIEHITDEDAEFLSDFLSIFLVLLALGLTIYGCISLVRWLYF